MIQRYAMNRLSRFVAGSLQLTNSYAIMSIRPICYVHKLPFISF